MQTENKKATRVWPIRLFGSIFIIVGLAVGSLGLTSYIRTQLANSWPSTPCTITELRIVSSSGSDSTTYRLHANYHYTVNGKKFNNDQVDFSFGSDSNHSYWKKIEKELRRAKKKNKAVCYYNPDDPSQAVLIRETRLWSLFFMLGFGLVFCIAGCGVTFGLPALMRMQNRNEEQQQALIDSPQTVATAERQPLPVTSLKMTAGFMTGFALFWNSLSWIAFIGFLVSDEKKELGIIAIISLFPLIGLALLVGAFFAIRRWLRQKNFQYALPDGALLAGGKGDLHLYNLPAAQRWQMQVAEVRPQQNDNGGNNSMSDPFVLWSYDLSVSDDEVRQRDRSIRLPIALPNDAENTGGVSWQLIFTSKATGTVRIPLPISPGQPGPLTRDMISDAVEQPSKDGKKANKYDSPKRRSNSKRPGVMVLLHACLG